TASPMAAGEHRAGLGDSGFVNLTAEYREQERTMRSGIDERTGRRDNISMGDPAFHRQSLALNSGFGLGDDIEVYGFGTYTGARPPRRPTIAWLRWRRRCIRTASRRARTATRTTMRSSPGCAASVCWMPGTGT
ncbi:hypothetical protein ACP3P8_20675, partial [Pseudomonas aeruginosa]